MIAVRHSLSCVTIPQLIAECAPERGNEPSAQGTALGNKDNITDGALTGQKLYRWGNAYAPPGRNYYTAYKTQGAALGYMVAGLSDRRCTDELLINPNP